MKACRDLTRRQDSAGPTRRAFLLSLLGGLVAAGIPGCGPRYREPTWLGPAVYDRAAAARLGLAYLDAHPGEYDAQALVTLIEAAAGDLPSDSQTALDALRRHVGDEYASDTVVTVSGWILSRTEARLYALAALDGPPVTP